MEAGSNPCFFVADFDSGNPYRPLSWLDLGDLRIRSTAPSTGLGGFGQKPGSCALLDAPFEPHAGESHDQWQGPVSIDL